MSADHLNTQVTGAIFKAEHALDDAIREWEEVERVEGELSKCPDVSDTERAIGHRGNARAGTVVVVLKALRGER